MIDGYAFIGEARGSFRIQFKDKDGKLTTIGDYLDVPRSLFNQFELTDAPDLFLAKQLKPHFEWRAITENVAAASDDGVGCGCIDGKDGQWV